MKKLLRTLLCAGILVTALSVSAFAAGREAPELQGDFYVLVNGQYVTFADAVPQLKDGRSYLPFVAVFDQLGFSEENMTWDAASATVTAEKEEVSISLTEGSATITVDRSGEVTQYQTDAAPYIDASTSRTYIPFGLAAEALGYNVGWDAQTGTVIIDDVDAILAANNETYELMDRYLDYSRTYAEDNQQVTGTYAVGMDIAGTMVSEGQSIAMGFNFLADGDYEMITSGSTALEFDTEMGLDLSMTMNGEEVAGLMEALGSGLPESVDVSMRGDLSDGALYFQSAALEQLVMGQEQPANAWYRMDLKEMFDQMSGVMGMDYAALLQLSAASLDMTFEEQLELLLRTMEPTSVQLTASDYLAQLNALCADSSFERSGSRYVNTLNFGEGDSSGSVQEVDGTFTLYTSGSRVTGYALEMTAAVEEEAGALSMTLSAAMEGDRMEMAMDYTVTAEDSTVSFNMTMDGTYRTTSAQPETEPPAGAQIIDVTVPTETVPA